jgi:sporulation protein YlmC with PRC-barrel domain
MRRLAQAIPANMETKMKSPFLTAALLSAAVIGSTAYAQNQPAPASPPAASTTTTTTTTSGDKMMLKGQWRASKLIGLKVYNEANESLGDINELIVDKAGKINAVVIGVGGFLGMGEHDIAVTIDKLKFVEEAVRTSSTTTTPTTTTPATTERRDTATTGAATSTTTTTTTTPRQTTVTANDWVPDHAVMSGTKEQLKAMPQFKYSDYN